MTKIDDLKPGQRVMLAFNGKEETARFVELVGENEQRKAVFEQVGGGGEPFTWEAYRYRGRWAYGTSADILRLIAVLPPKPVMRFVVEVTVPLEEWPEVIHGLSLQDAESQFRSDAHEWVSGMVETLRSTPKWADALASWSVRSV